jgi:hypothetical protein
MDKQGLLLCARYSVAPNFFGYCGPEKNSSLVDYLKEGIGDREVKAILTEFDTLFSYLKLISTENKIVDPFDRRVIEAYWLGNPLLENISNLNYLYLLEEKLSLEKKIDKKNFQKIKTKIMTHPFVPHHAFHVFNIFKRTGNDPSFHTLTTMDECRIGWGKVKSISPITVIVETKPLEIAGNKLQFGRRKLKEVRVGYKDKRFVKEINQRDWISFHWSMICDVVRERQVKNLEFYTKKAINFYNQSK